MTIVLKTEGKWDSVDYVTVLTFLNKEDAEKYCVENTDNPMEKKYWSFCKIIDSDHTYDISRYSID